MLQVQRVTLRVALMKIFAHYQHPTVSQAVARRFVPPDQGVAILGEVLWHRGGHVNSLKWNREKKKSIKQVYLDNIFPNTAFRVQTRI